MAWKAPEEHTDNKIGTADDPVIAAAAGNVPLSIAAWARLARTVNVPSEAKDFRARAERLWDHLVTSESATGNPLLLVGALELHKTTGDDKYLKFARRAAASKRRSRGLRGTRTAKQPF